MKFLLQGGDHEVFGKIYVRGEVVESNDDLCVMWPGKFIKTNDAVPASDGRATPHGNIDQQEREKIERKRQQDAQTHQDAVKANIEAARIANPANATPPLNGPQAGNGEPGVGSGASILPGGDKPKPKGKNVTAEFPKAKEQDCSVYKQGKVFVVYDNDALDKPFNPDGCKKSEVNAVIEKNV